MIQWIGIIWIFLQKNKLRTSLHKICTKSFNPWILIELSVYIPGKEGKYAGPCRFIRGMEYVTANCWKSRRLKVEVPSVVLSGFLLSGFALLRFGVNQTSSTSAATNGSTK